MVRAAARGETWVRLVLSETAFTATKPGYEHRNSVLSLVAFRRGLGSHNLIPSPRKPRRRVNGKSRGQALRLFSFLSPFLATVCDLARGRVVSPHSPTRHPLAESRNPVWPLSAVCLCLSLAITRFGLIRCRALLAPLGGTFRIAKIGRHEIQVAIQLADKVTRRHARGGYKLFPYSDH